MTCVFDHITTCRHGAVGGGSFRGGGASGNCNGHGFNTDELPPAFKPGGLSNTTAAPSDGGGAGGSGGAVGGGIDIAQCPGKVFDSTYTCHGKGSCPYCR
jgi:hypothetical protein